MSTPAILNDYREEPVNTRTALMIYEAITGLECVYELLEHAHQEPVQAHKIALLMKPHIANLKNHSENIPTD